MAEGLIMRAIFLFVFTISFFSCFAASDLPPVTVQTIQDSASIEEFFALRKQISTDEIEAKLAKGFVITKLTITNYQMESKCFARKYCWHFEHFDLTVSLQNPNSGEPAVIEMPDCSPITREPNNYPH